MYYSSRNTTMPIFNSASPGEPLKEFLGKITVPRIAEHTGIARNDFRVLDGHPAVTTGLSILSGEALSLSPEDRTKNQATRRLVLCSNEAPVAQGPATGNRYGILLVHRFGRATGEPSNKLRGFLPLKQCLSPYAKLSRHKSKRVDFSQYLRLNGSSLEAMVLSPVTIGALSFPAFRATLALI